VPQTVTMFLSKEEKVDTDKIQIEVPPDDLQQQSSPSTGENPFGEQPAAADAEKK
jgi:hypothetical protein